VLVGFEAKAYCPKRAHPLFFWHEDPPEASDELPSVSSRSLPPIETAVRFRIYVQHRGCRPMALQRLRDAFSRARHTPPLPALRAMRHLRKSRAAADFAGESDRDSFRGRQLAEAARAAVRALPE